VGAAGIVAALHLGPTSLARTLARLTCAFEAFNSCISTSPVTLRCCAELGRLPQGLGVAGPMLPYVVLGACACASRAGKG
jgi:hypothetical protein